MKNSEFNMSGGEEGTGRLGSGGIITLGEHTVVSEQSTPSGHDYFDDGTLPATEERERLGRETLSSSVTRIPATGKMDRELLSRAENIVEGFNIDDPLTSRVDRDSLCGAVLQLWEKSNKCSDYHQDILAILENGLLSTEKFEMRHLSVFREAIKDLQNETLTQAHIDVIQRRFMEEGMSPLALLTEVDKSGESKD
ncbi:MAG: hypothetical protein ABSB91_06060 [Sedimentisphaerales bacterium]